MRDTTKERECICTDTWISINDRLPEDDNDCLITDGESMMVGYYRDDAKAWDNDCFGWVERDDSNEIPTRLGKIIAWMPLPEQYESE